MFSLAKRDILATNVRMAADYEPWCLYMKTIIQLLVATCLTGIFHTLLNGILLVNGIFHTVVEYVKNVSYF